MAGQLKVSPAQMQVLRTMYQHNCLVCVFLPPTGPQQSAYYGPPVPLTVQVRPGSVQALLAKGLLQVAQARIATAEWYELTALGRELAAQQKER